MLRQTLKFCTMLSIASSSSRIGHKRIFLTLSCLILCSLVLTSKAAVIKKRDTVDTLTHSGSTASKLKVAEVVPTILTALPDNASSIFTTKWQSINSDQNFSTESSKELANNEISINEAKKLMLQKEEEDQLNNANIEIEKDKYQIKENMATKSPDILQDFTTRNDIGLSSNAIKEEQVTKFNEKELVSADNKNSSSIENTLSPTMSSKMFQNFKPETEEPVGLLKVQSKQLDNNIENSKEYLQNELKLDKQKTSMQQLEETTIRTLAATTSKNVSSIEIKNSDEESVKTKTNEIKEQELPLKSLEMSTTTESWPISLQNQIKAPASSNKEDSEQKSNHIYDVEQIQSLLTTPEPLLALDETTIKPATKEDHLLVVHDNNKQDYARSMFREVTTTSTPSEDEGALTQLATTQSAKLSRKTNDIEDLNQEKLKDLIEDSNRNDLANLNVKEKKPKFINDNSTNAQQLNLPNNAEVWSLAGMKSLPKANITMETTQAHNNTHKELQEMQNTSSSVNNNSEKNLLDWSQIMMNKELSTTARIEGGLMKERKPLDYTKDVAAALDTTTELPTNEFQQFKAPAAVNVINKNSVAEQEFTTNTIPPALTTTILSTLNYNKNDKKVEENMNNHIDTVMATLAATKPANVDSNNNNTNYNNSNPFNTSLNIEPNINKINLTSNQSEIVINNDVHTTGMKNAVNEDVNADTQMETNTVTAMPTTTTTTTSSSSTTTTAKTKATAVIDMTTLEQIFSETTTVSILETSKQNASLNNVAPSEQQKNKTNNSVINEQSNYSVSASHNEFENALVDRQNSRNEENIDLNAQRTTANPTTTTTIIPVTTFRPTTILVITSTTSPISSTFQQEVDQNSNEIQKNLTKNEQQQSIIKTDLQYNHATQAVETHLTAREFETTTLETLTSTAAPPAELTTNKIENTLTSSWEHETITTTSAASGDDTINVTTAISLDSGEETTTTTASTQSTPKQAIEYQNKGDKEATTGSAVFSEDGKFEKESKTTAAAATTSSTVYSLETSTETTTPVVIVTESGWAVIGTTTPPTTTTTAAEKSTIGTTTAKQESDTEENALSKEDTQIEIITTTTTATENMNKTQEIITSTTALPATTSKEEETYISLLDDSTTTTTTSTSTSTAATYNTTTFTPPPSPPTSTLPPAITTKLEDIYNVINSTTTELIQTTTTTTATATQQLLTEIDEDSSTESTFTTTTSTEATTSTTQTSQIIATADIGGNTLPTLTSIMGGNSGNMYPKNPEASGETDVNVIIAITVSVIGVVALVLLVGFLYLMRKRQKQTSYSQRCRPVSLDEYTIDNASVSGSMRKSSALRASKRTYGNLAFDDPALRPNPMGVQELAKFVQEKLRMFEEFRDVPQITSRLDEVPTGCEDKNRYANVLPLPETRVVLQRLNDDEKSEYINANYVTGPKDPPNYYIACQAPLESTVEDFWRMIWEQQSRVIIQATDLIENGVEKCAEYLPPSVTLDNHSSFGDFQITLQNREVKDKYAISTILIKHVGENATRELTHYWYKWPEVGVPMEEAPIIAMLLEARSSLISYAIEQANEDKEKLSTGTLKSNEEDTSASANAETTPTINNTNGTTANVAEINGNISMVHIKKSARNQGPLTVHCSPGTGRTGTIIACDIAIRSLETPKRIVDIPQIVYYVRRGRASAVLTKEQYEFIYKVASMYAAKITNPTNYN